MKYVIPAVLAFVSGLVLWQLQRPQVSLDYEVVTSEQFPRAAGVGRYFVVRVRNVGNREIRDIDFVVTLRSGAIETKQFSQPSLISQVSESQSELKGRLPLLNPSETFAMTLTGAGDASVGPVEVTARAPGATATPRSDEQLMSGTSGKLLWVFAFALAAFAVSLLSSFRTAKVSDSIAQIENLGEVSKRIEKTEEDLATRLDKQRQENEKTLQEQKQGKAGTPQLLFSVFNRSGLGHRFSELVAGAEDVTFWKTGLFLMHCFLVDETNRDSYVAAAESIVDLPGMAPSSRGFNLYLLGKMEQFRGRSERAIHWFERCRTDTPLMYAHMMAQDPAYDLAAIRLHLLKGQG